MERSQRSHGHPELLEIVATPIAVDHVAVEAGLRFPVHCPVEVIGDQLYEFVAIQRFPGSFIPSFEVAFQGLAHRRAATV